MKLLWKRWVWLVGLGCVDIQLPIASQEIPKAIDETDWIFRMPSATFFDEVPKLRHPTMKFPRDGPAPWTTIAEAGHKLKGNIFHARRY